MSEDERVVDLMKIRDKLYFAPSFLLLQLAYASSREIVDAFESRINEYYFNAAEILNREKQAFGAGAICFDAVDAIAKYEFGGGRVGDRFKRWISRLPDFENLTWNELERVYDDFRNGVTHEARIKNGGQFTYDIAKAVYIENDVVSINPERLLEQMRGEFARVMNQVRQDPHEINEFANSIRSDFEEDLKRLEENQQESRE